MGYPPKIYLLIIIIKIIIIIIITIKGHIEVGKGKRSKINKRVHIVHIKNEIEKGVFDKKTDIEKPKN